MSLSVRPPPSWDRSSRSLACAAMAQDVSRYLSWESIIYPDGGTCVPGELCGAAPSYRAASAARMYAVCGSVRSLRPASPRSVLRASARLDFAKAWGTCATPMGTGEPPACQGSSASLASGTGARSAPLAAPHRAAIFSRNPKARHVSRAMPGLRALTHPPACAVAARCRNVPHRTSCASAQCS